MYNVCGNVNQPGVYELQQDSRVFEAIEAAGGMTTTAAFSYLNQAELLKDGQQIYVPSQEEVDSGKLRQPEMHLRVMRHSVCRLRKMYPGRMTEKLI